MELSRFYDRMAKKKKIRADFRKNRSVRARTTDWTRRYRQHGFEEEAPPQSERISGKGELARRRTVCGEHAGRPGRARAGRPPGRGREALPPRTGALRAGARQHGRGRDGQRLPAAPPAGC